MRPSAISICKTFTALATLLLLSYSSVHAARSSLRIAENGKALQPIVVSVNASDATKVAATQLAAYLKRISGAPFEVKIGDGTSGIAVGTAAEFPAFKPGREFDAGDSARREEYVLRSTPTGVLLVGATDLAVQNAVWDFLYRLGYRQFFPGKNWEIVPHTPSLAVALDVKEKPSYLARSIWFSYGTWPEQQKEMDAWNAKNRVHAGFKLKTAHAYPEIIKRHAAEFKLHPEYLTKPGSSKFCVSNPGLRQLVIDDALKYFADNPNADSYSVDPSDGGGWESDSCPDGEKIGSVSNRVVMLANVVAEAVEKKFPGKRIGTYAYNDHSPPPTIKVHPNVVVSIATAFIKGGYTVHDLVAGWAKQGAALGIRDYYSIIAWDGDLPGKSRARKLSFMKHTIPLYYEHGARFLSAESSDNWGPNGLGYYVASRLLWDVEDAAKVEELENDFLAKCFGVAKPTMTEFYRLLRDPLSAMLSDDLLGRLYGTLAKAKSQTGDVAVLARLNDLALYVRYIELRRNFQLADAKTRQQAFEKLLRFAYRIRGTHMVHSNGLWRDLPARNRGCKIPAEAAWRVPEDKNPWKSSEPFDQQTIDGFIKSGVERYKVVNVEPKEFSTDLVPATALNLDPVRVSDYGDLHGVQEFYVWAGQPGTMSFKATAGIFHTNRGSAEITLFSVDAPAKDEAGNEANHEVPASTPLHVLEAPSDKQQHEYSFELPRAGLYRVQVRFRTMGVRMKWPEDMFIGVRSALGETTRFGGRWQLYFYVPKGTKSVGGFAYGSGVVRDADGKEISTYPAKNGYFNIPVSVGQDGKLWSFEAASGQIGLMTVPPYLACSEKELLLPKEVVEADAR